MLQLKFRAWDKEKQCWFKPTYQAYGGKLEELSIGLDGRLLLRTMDGMTDESIFPNRFELVQFTGLKDKNGVDIYEGNIVKFEVPDYDKQDGMYLPKKEILSEVVFENGCFDAMYRWWSPEDCAAWDETEVIGNKYEGTKYD